MENQLVLEFILFYLDALLGTRIATICISVEKSVVLPIRIIDELRTFELACRI